MSTELNGAPEATVGPIRDALKAERKTAAQTLAIVAGVVAWDVSAGRVATLDLTADATLAISNAPLGEFLLQVDQTPGEVLTLPVGLLVDDLLAAAVATPSTVDGLAVYRFHNFGGGVLLATLTKGYA